MIENIVSVPLPADLPENWTDNQYVTPGGTEAGLTEQHGFNYLMKQVNNAQQASKEMAAQVHRVSGELSASGWYRVAKCSDSASSSSFELAIDMLRKTSEITSCVVTVGGYWGRVNLAQTLVTSLGAINQVRIVHPSSSGPFYVEVYYGANVSNTTHVTIRNLTSGATVEPVDFERGSVPSGYSSTEYKLILTLGAGVVGATVG